MVWASLTVVVLSVYLGIGLLFSLAFAVRGAARIDSAAESTALGFRLLILPGVAALWPYLALRWLRGRPPPVEGNAHRRAAGNVS